ncbi:MAG: hypothetical protein NZ583_00200 [Desulfobacterota bacterium]|nr:hypothetical protein [Thermodesulfobacteriota bacterium]MDW8001134.1 hypothetical protein [Deltaproteobacteria bacterium]
MKVKVTLSTNLVPSGSSSIPKEIELPGDKNTLLSLLKILNEKFPHLKLIEDEHMGEDLRYVYLNGVSHFELPLGLKTPISDSDKVHVEIFMEPLAGG